MKINGLLILISFSFFACNDDDGPVAGPVTPPDDPIDTLFWDMPHSRFLGLKGAVSSCVRVGLDDESTEFERMTMLFDTCGRLLWYDPVGLTADVPLAYEIGWIDPATYRYEYNDKGQLVTMTLAEMGNTPVVYRLKYGEHGRYVPLPFHFGPLSFFLMRDLTEVKSEGMTYLYADNKAAYSTTSWMGTTSVVYDFKGDYPETCTETTFRGADTSRLRVTIYTFGDKGRLEFSDQRTTYPGTEDEERVNVTYSPLFLVLPWVEVLSINGEPDTRYEYKYDVAGNLTVKSYQRGLASGDPEDGDEERNTYSGGDEYGNWTEWLRVIPGMGTMKYRRELQCWK